MLNLDEMDESHKFYALGVSDIWYDEGKPTESDIEDEMDRADEMLDYGIRHEWREWGDTDELDDLDN